MNSPVLLQCPSCASPLQARDVDLGRRVVKCAHCGVLMTLPEPAMDAAGSSAETGWRPRSEVPLPASIRVKQAADAVIIRRRWFSAPAILLAVFCVFWDGFLVFWYGMAFHSGAPLVAKLFPLIHVSVGVGLTYFCLASLFNSTLIRLTWKEMSIRHGPVPWPGNQAIPRAEIDQLYCVRKERRGKYGPVITFEVWLKTSTAVTRKLLGAGLTEQQALALEQQIERALGIPDRAVPGEIAR